MSSTTEQLYEAAKKVRENAISSHTGVAVGCALKADNGKIYSGANLEHSLIGISLCAERVAIGTMISEGARKIQEIYVVSEFSPPWAPCAVCRQALFDFVDKDTVIRYGNVKGEVESTNIEELYPLTADLNPNK